MDSGFFEVKLTRSPIGYDRSQKEVLRGMGLRKLGSKKLLKDTDQVRGMIFKMSHLVEIKSFKSEAEYKKYRETQDALGEKPVKVLSLPKAEVKKAAPSAKTAKKKPARAVKKAAPKADVKSEPKAAKKTVKKSSVKSKK